MAVTGTKIADDRRQAVAVDKLHRVVVNTRVAADAENRHDVRMMKLRRRLHFDVKPLPLLGVGRGRVRQNFQSNPTAERDLLRLVDDAHSATADLAEDVEISEPRLGRQGWLGQRGRRVGG